jgi:heat shock protein HtpX
MDNLFATHPSTENRVAALQELARQMGLSGYRRPAAAPAEGPWGDRGGASRGPWG